MRMSWSSNRRWHSAALIVVVVCAVLVFRTLAASAQHWGHKVNSEGDLPKMEVVFSDNQHGEAIVSVDDADVDDEAAYAPLERSLPRLADRLKRVFAEEFVRQVTDFELNDVISTTDLVVAANPDVGTQTLRMTSAITGATYWYVDWNGSEASAELWARSEVAPAQAANALHDLGMSRPPRGRPSDGNAATGVGS